MGDLSLLRHIPSGAKRLATRHDGHLDQGIAILRHPADGGVTRLVDGYAATLVFGDDLVLLLQTSDDTIHRIHKVLLFDRLLVVASRNERRLVADVCYVCSREAWRLSCQLIHIYIRSQLESLHMYEEDLLAVVQVGQVYVDLTVEASST